jgi:N-acetylmuramoyl-L-alanine amidase
MLNIIKKQISQNYTDGVFAKKYIVIHETDNEDKGANALAHYNYWNSNANAKASTTFVVDDKMQVQMMDLEDKGWSVGVVFGNPRTVTDATNANTVNIEICVNEDGDYAKAVQNTIDLVKYLMPLVGIPASRVIRHWDACKKYCPRRMMDRPSIWTDFVMQINGKPATLEVPKTRPIDPTVADRSVQDLQGMLKLLGFRGSNGKPLAVDGLRGTNTTFAIKTFQGVMELVQDGVAGSLTLDAMQHILRKPVCGVGKPASYYATRYIQYSVGAGVDGSFGGGTELAVKTWQLRNKLVADGVVGNASWTKLIN